MDAGLKRKLITALVLSAVFAGLVAVFLDSNYLKAAYSLRGRRRRILNSRPTAKSEQLSDLPRQGCGAEFLGDVVRSVRGGNAVTRRVAETHRSTRWNGSRRQPGRRPGGLPPFFEELYRIDFTTYRDASKKTALEFGTTKYPETYIINRRGRIDRKIKSGRRIGQSPGK